MILEFKKRKAERAPEYWRTRRVFFEDFPTVRTIFYKGWRIINLCAPEGGLSVFLDN